MEKKTPMRVTFDKFDAMSKLSDLKTSKHQRNKHPTEQIERLAKIMREHGVRHPISVSRLSGEVCFGHGRWAAAKLNGWKSYPVVMQDFANDQEEYACVQSDNGIALWAELDIAAINSDLLKLGEEFDLDLLGIKDLELVRPDVEPGCDEDDVPEVVEPKTKLGDIYQLGRHRLMCGDSTSVDALAILFQDDSPAELCFTSPPYADQREYRGGKELSTEHLAKFISTAFGRANYFVVNLGLSRKEGEVNTYWDDYINEAKACGLKLLSWNVWNRSGLAGYSIGQITAMFPIEHEFIFVFGGAYNKLNKTVPNKDSGVVRSGFLDRQKDGSMSHKEGVKIGAFRAMGTVYSGGVVKGNESGHPAAFPVEFPEKYIEAMTDEDDGVYEPFGGSGSTLIACEKTNRKCFMMELDPHYCDVIVARWEKYTGQQAELTNGQPTIKTKRKRDTVSNGATA